MSAPRIPLRPLTAAALAALLTACASTTKLPTPEAEAPTLAEGGLASVAEAGATAEAPVASWWTALRDPVLDGIVAETLAANGNVRIAVQNVRDARALARESRLDLFPSGGTTISIEEQRQSAAASPQFGQPGQTGPQENRTQADVGISATWELDLWGRVRQSVAAARLDADATEADLAGARAAAVADAVRAYVDLRTAQARFDVAQRNEAVQARTLALVEASFAAGRGTSGDVGQARAQLETTRAALPQLDAAQAVARNRLAVLQGKPPSALRTAYPPVEGSLTLPGSFPVGDALGLLRRRPDVRAAEARLAAANTRVKQGIASLYPTISLVGSAGSTGAPEDLFSEPTIRFGIGPSLTWSLFDAGRTRFLLDAADARAVAAYEQWRLTALTALEDADNALTQLAREKVRNDALRRALVAAREAERVALLRYENGRDPLSFALTAQANLLAAEDALAQSDAALAQAFVATHQALGLAFEPGAPA